MITGASTGIGAACALALDARGVRVFAGVRDPTAGAALAAQASSRLAPLTLDVTDEASIAAAVRSVRDAVGAAGLAGLVNNAGLAISGPVETLPVADWRRQFEVNVFGLVAVTQGLLPLLRRGRGRVINMGSIAGLAATPFMAPYSASKHAVEALTDALRLELQPTGVHVAVIEPGAIATPIWGKARAGVEAQVAGWPSEARSLYEPGLRGLAEAAARAERRASPPSLVVSAVLHALCAPRPRTRYLVGRDARLRALLARWLPDRLQDRLLTSFMGLPPRP